MDNLHARPLALLTLLALVLAGCAANEGGGNGGNGVQLPPAMTTAEAQALLERAGNATPDKLAIQMAALRGSQTLLALNGTMDNATRTLYMDIRGDPEVIQALTQGSGESPGMGEMFGDLGGGFAIYATSQGGLYLINGTAFVFPSENGTEEGSSPVPSPEDNPFAELLDPKEGLAAFATSNATVNAVKPVVVRGQPAVELNVTATEDGNNLTGVVTVFTNPARLARVEGTMQEDDEAPDLLKGARYVADFYYEGPQLTPPESVTRALGLAYKSNMNPFAQQEEALVWTFQVDGGIPLGEVEVQVKNGEDSDPSDLTGMGKLPNLWTMRLTEKNRTQDGVTLAFNDADNDGQVSKGDTLRIEAEEGTPTVVLYDTKTGVHVVPGPAFALVLAALGALALLLRRRG